MAYVKFEDEGENEGGPERVKVASGDFVRNIGYWQERAHQRPIGITHHGRERFVLTTSEHFDGLCAQHADGPPQADEQAEIHRAAADAITENMAEAFILRDHDLKIIQVNHAAENFLGRSRATLVGRVVGVGEDVLVRELREVARSRRATAFEMDSTVRPGARLAVRLFPHPLGVASLISDITIEAERARELQTLRSLRAAVGGHGDVAMLTLDQMGRLTSVDAAFLSWSGFEAGMMAGRMASDVVLLRQRRAFEGVLRAVATGREIRHCATVFLSKTGEELPLQCVFAPIEEGFGVTGVVMVATRAAVDEARAGR